MDFSSWSSVLSTIASLLFMTLMMVGIRLIFMQTIQKRRERENRQINERLKTLIAAYKVLGGSFTGTLTVSPLHLRDLVRASTRPAVEDTDSAERSDDEDEDDALSPPQQPSSSERHRRMRDAVEAALSDIILLGTEEQVRMAAQAAQDMVQGRDIETAALVTSLRSYIREALDLEPIPSSIRIPNQGPTRTGSASGARRPGAAGGTGGSGAAGGGRNGGGGGMGMGMGLGAMHRGDDS